jgi:hypothetical protein
MKGLIIAASLIAISATAASAQVVIVPYSSGHYPYAERHHRVCQEKAWRLHSFERRATADGHLSRREREEIAYLRRDLDRTCGRYRWRG